jgi:hypothetical protein
LNYIIYPWDAFQSQLGKLKALPNTKHHDRKIIGIWKLWHPSILTPLIISRLTLSVSQVSVFLRQGWQGERTITRHRKTGFDPAVGTEQFWQFRKDIQLDGSFREYDEERMHISP